VTRMKWGMMSPMVVAARRVMSRWIRWHQDLS
jgi:hypothetical protein